ncbi:MAG: FtsX-like permease family protein [Armatimonadetes bacterium]|nr:FtsX-like permease family protein [Armatimonadota bacterium]
MSDHKKLGRQVHLPFRKSVEIAMNNIRLRLGRSTVTAFGILLGIAFLASVLVQGAVNAGIKTDMTPDAIKQQYYRQVWLVTLALLMSTIGITNSMLMSVTERFKEIGTMKCLGALDSFVVRMFILEGMFMGVLASAAGAIVGGGIMLLSAGWSLGWSSVRNVSMGQIGLILLVCLGVGTFLTFLATIAPAIRAARMPPAAALRAEI